MEIVKEQLEAAYLAVKKDSVALKNAKMHNSEMPEHIITEIVGFSDLTIARILLGGNPFEEISATTLTFFTLGVQVGIKLRAAQELEELMEK